MDLQLPKTNIRYANGTLSRTKSDGTVLAAFSEEEIIGVRVEIFKDYGPALIFMFLSASLAVVSKIYIPSPAWSWVAAIVCTGAFLFSMLMVNARKLVIETKNGIVAYPIQDPFEEADGFVLSLRGALEKNA